MRNTLDLEKKSRKKKQKTKQGLTTNDVFALSKAPSLYSAFLSPQGRIISDVFFHREEQGGSDGGGGGREAAPTVTTPSSSPPPLPPPSSLFAEVDASVAPQILSLLRRYRLRAQVDIEDVGEDYEVVVKGFFGGGGGGGAEGQAEEDAAAAEEEEEGAWPRDPRGLRALGLRTVLPSSAACVFPSAAAAAAAAAASASSASSSSSSSYAAARYFLGVAEGAELEPGRGTPLEANLDGLRGVCFTKGCYVGQELVARAHFRGQVHKRVMPVRVLEGAGVGAGGGGGRAGLVLWSVVTSSSPPPPLLRTLLLQRGPRAPPGGFLRSAERAAPALPCCA